MKKKTRRTFLGETAAVGVTIAMGCGNTGDEANDGSTDSGSPGAGGTDSGNGSSGSSGAPGDGGTDVIDGGNGTDAGTIPGQSFDCIVVGGGTAGLSAALKLHLEGHDNFKVFEKYGAAGGICGAAEEHGYRFPMGTTYISMPWAGSAVSELYSALKAALGKDWYTRIPQPFDSMYKDGIVTVGATVFGNWNDLPNISKDQSDQCEQLRKMFKKMYGNCEWPIWANRNGPLHQYEMMTAKQLINQEVSNTDAWILGALESFCRGVLNGSLDEVSALQAIDMFGDEYVSVESIGPLTETIVGASTYVVADMIDAIVTAMGAGRLAVDSEVQSVQKVGDEVVVRVKEGNAVYAHKCKYCIVATNAVAAGKLIQDIPANVKNALGSIAYGEYAVVNLVMKNHTVGINAYDCTLGKNIIDDIYDFTFISKTLNKVPLTEPPQVLGCYIAAENKNDHRPTMAQDALVDMCLAQVDTMFGQGTRDHVTSTHVRQYSKGIPIFHPGLTWEQETNLMPMFNDRFILAGDYVQGSPTIEGAVEAGWHAASQIAKKL